MKSVSKMGSAATASVMVGLLGEYGGLGLNRDQLRGRHEIGGDGDGQAGDGQRNQKARHGTQRGGAVAAFEAGPQPGAKNHGTGREQVAKQGRQGQLAFRQANQDEVASLDAPRYGNAEQRGRPAAGHLANAARTTLPAGGAAGGFHGNQCPAVLNPLDDPAMFDQSGAHQPSQPSSSIVAKRSSALARDWAASARSIQATPPSVMAFEISTSRSSIPSISSTRIGCTFLAISVLIAEAPMAM